MTERVRIEHSFETSEKGFWDTFLNADYNREMFEGRMKFPSWKLSRFDLSESEMVRTVEVEPFVGALPGPIKKVIGESIRYREEGKLDRVKNSYKLEVIPGKFADKISVKGEQYTKADGEGRCTRIFVAEINVKIFGIGSMIEKNIAGDMRKSYDVGAEFTQKWMNDHGVE